MKKLIGICCISAIAFSFEFQPLGFRSIGIGGAGVASASGSAAAYYNPALLAKNRYTTEISLSTGIGIREINLINPIDKLANEDKLTETIDNIKNHAPFSGTNDKTDIEHIQDALKQLYKLSQGNGFEVLPTAEFSIQVSHFALGVYGIGDLSANAHIDRKHLYLIFKDEENGGYYYYYPKTDTYGATDKETYEKYSLEYALDNNLTYLNIKGIGIAEVPISYANTINANNIDISIGINLKYIQGYTYMNKIAIDSDEDTLRNSLTDNSKTSSTYGVDLGFLISKDDFKAGIVGKYLNSPKLKFYDGSEYTIKPMIRSGVAIDYNDFLTLAMDIDLTQNSTLIPGYKSQYIGGGIDLHQSWFSLRGGAMYNMAEDDEGLILTAGLGLGLKWFQLDIAGEMATKSGTYNGNSIPRYFKVNLALLSRWGG
ncbi:hypothetical protein FE773_06210 [Caminibacter mediatlanticus TB-2]|uniref:Conjugal transfer protein TraF n=1 Tax=Caminibacter mediatlanticus TB-2 TaxID=391592 RepID=A0ABX5V924_9BACT|nr:conjugal transfer protein TraF [Caminibacter mediatlanticus]QCT94787.1 hypothetical protein FE773_06210 [Caminibacter mediatlanticus TB-2]